MNYNTFLSLLFIRSTACCGVVSVPSKSHRQVTWVSPHTLTDCSSCLAPMLDKDSVWRMIFLTPKLLPFSEFFLPKTSKASAKGTSSPALSNTNQRVEKGLRILLATYKRNSSRNSSVMLP